MSGSIQSTDIDCSETTLSIHGDAIFRNGNIGGSIVVRHRKTSFFRILLAFLPSVVLGSILYQSAALTYVYSKDGVFMVAFLTYLATRSMQFALTLVVEAAVTDLLFRSRIFHRVGLWPVKTRND